MYIYRYTNIKHVLAKQWINNNAFTSYEKRGGAVSWQTVCAYVLVNNRAEGNAPLTVEALVGMLRV
jgi:hypothetical protein